VPSSAWIPALFRRGRRLPSLIAILIALTLIAADFAVAGLVPENEARLRVMTYNVRFATDTPPNAWPDRLPMMKQLIRRQSPDVLGVQEPVWRQIRDLDGALPEYDWVGMGCLGGTRSGFTAIFYRKDRLELLDFGYFWLSDTPDVIGSSTWGNEDVRMVTWSKLRDRRDGRVFYQVNTHFDNYSENARVKSARLVLGRVRAFEAGIPVLLTGDFNAATKTRPYAILTGPDAFTDTWPTARRRGPQYGTFGGWRSPVPGGDRIDWILARGEIDTLWTAVDSYEGDGQYPSDHFPVIADILIKP
jgi:endonuclease/exonuclease/phosphatase family metal-dependent hydrolase